MAHAIYLSFKKQCMPLHINCLTQSLLLYYHLSLTMELQLKWQMYKKPSPIIICQLLVATFVLNCIALSVAQFKSYNYYKSQLAYDSD